MRSLLCSLAKALGYILLLMFIRLTLVFAAKVFDEPPPTVTETAILYFVIDIWRRVNR